MKSLRRLLSRGYTPSSNLESPPPNLPSPERSPQNPGDYLRATSGNNQRHFFQGVRRVDINQANFVQHNDANAAQAESSRLFVNQNAGNVAGINSCPSFRALHEIYYEELLKQKRGSPLWFPGPSSNVPVQYRHNGVNVGDVGIFRMDEPFDFLFNIFRPADDPINAKGVPEDFLPLERGETFEDRCDPNGGCIGSSVVSQSSNHSERSALVFETSASEGAILVLPEGADRKVVRSLKSMKDYMTPSTVQNWYRYAMDVRGRDVQNGDIRLLYGCDKAASWGIATFSTVEGNTTSFVFNETKDCPSGSHTYCWTCNGSANTHTRVGPSVEEGAVQNQCIFLQTWNAQLSAESWRRMQGILVQADDRRQCPLYTYDYMSLVGQSNRSDPARNATNSSVMHPSSSLNQSLLDICKNAEMAVTTDDDWMSLMTEDGELPTGHRLVSMIQRSHRICVKDGVVSLEYMECNEDEIEVGDDTQKAGSSATSYNSSGSNTEPDPQRVSHEESLGLSASYKTKPLEKIESQTLPRIGRLSSLTQLLRNFADTDMNSWQVVIALIVLFAYVYPSMRFLPLIVLTTLVHRFSVANPAERTAARREISSESHGPSRDPRSKPPVTSTAEMDKSKNSNLSEIISNFFLRLSVLYCAWRGRQDKGLTIWDLVMLAGASQYLFVYAFWRFRLLPVKVALVAKYPKSEITIRRWIPLPKPAVRIYRWFTCPPIVPTTPRKNVFSRMASFGIVCAGLYCLGINVLGASISLFFFIAILCYTVFKRLYGEGYELDNSNLFLSLLVANLFQAIGMFIMKWTTEGVITTGVLSTTSLKHIENLPAHGSLVDITFSEFCVEKDTSTEYDWFWLMGLVIVIPYSAIYFLGRGNMNQIQHQQVAKKLIIVVYTISVLLLNSMIWWKSFTNHIIPDKAILIANTVCVFFGFFNFVVFSMTRPAMVFGNRPNRDDPIPPISLQPIPHNPPQALHPIQQPPP